MKMLTLAVALVTSLTCTVSEGADKPKFVPYEEILTWLPEDSETLFVMHGPFKIEHSGDQINAQSTLDMLKASLRGLMGIGPLNDVEGLDKNSVMLTVEASRRFRSPKGLGLMPYEGGHVVVFQNDTGPIMASLEKKATRTEEIGGMRVAVSVKKEQDDTWTTYVTQPKPNVLVWATSRGCLEDVLSRMTIKAKTRAFPASLPEWKHLDTTAPFWGMRHYMRKDSGDDPSSPLAGGRRPANVPDDGAIGFATVIKGNVVEVHYLSSNKDATAIAGELWFSAGDQGPRPDLKSGGSGVVNVTFRLEENSPTNSIFLLVFLQALGHGVYL